MSKHTPGPWAWSDDDFDDSLKGPGGQDVLSAGVTATDDPYVRVGLVDANLIAAAPELLDALKACAAQMEDTVYMDESDPFLDAWKQAHAAIAKAEGKS
jgi:hypothetical protein